MRELVRIGVGGLISDDPPTLARHGKEPGREASDEASHRERSRSVRGAARPDAVVPAR
jgi:hypothetical protein